MQSCGGSSCLSDGEKTLRVQINGEAQEISDGLALSDLIAELSLAPERIAIEHNQHVVRRNEWPTTIIADGDRIEIVHFVGGGSEADR